MNFHLTDRLGVEFSADESNITSANIIYVIWRSFATSAQ